MLNYPDTTTLGAPVRRAEEVLTPEECIEVITRVDTAVLGTADAAGIPYAVPINPFYFEGKIYFHGVGNAQGRRYANLMQQPAVSLCVIGRSDINEPKITTDFVSVIVAGHVRIVEPRDEKHRLMRQMLVARAPSLDPDDMIEKVDHLLDVLNVYEITIDEMTGKAKPAGYERFFGREMPKRG